MIRHTSPKTTKIANNNENATHDIQTLLNSLTGLDLLVAFSVAVRPRILRKKQHADMLCFRKRDDKTSRVAIRWKGTGGATTSWTTATLTKILGVKDKLLELELTSRQDGDLLKLDGVVAVNGEEGRRAEKPERWYFQYIEDVSTIPSGIHGSESSVGYL